MDLTEARKWGCRKHGLTETFSTKIEGNNQTIKSWCIFCVAELLHLKEPEEVEKAELLEEEGRTATYYSVFINLPSEQGFPYRDLEDGRTTQKGN